MTASSTSAGYLKKSNFKEDWEEPVKSAIRLEVSRGDAKRMKTHRIKNYSQWFPGNMKDANDALSRDDDRTDGKQINMFCTFTPSQIPDHFEIAPLPNEICS